MPNKHFYFALGATHGAFIAAWIHRRRHVWYPRFAWLRSLYRWDRHWKLYLPFMIVAFGILALVPDILYALDILPKPVIRSAIFNLFYGYAWFERIEDIDPHLDWLFNTTGSLLLYGLALGTLGFYSQEAARRLKRSKIACCKTDANDQY